MKKRTLNWNTVSVTPWAVDKKCTIKHTHTHQEHVYATCLCITWAATTGLQPGRLWWRSPRFPKHLQQRAILCDQDESESLFLTSAFYRESLNLCFKPLSPAYFCCIRHKPSISLTTGRLLHVLICPCCYHFLSAQHVLSTKHISFLLKDIRRGSLTDMCLSAYGVFNRGLMECEEGDG